jgi:hypothetical protein
MPPFVLWTIVAIVAIVGIVLYVRHSKYRPAPESASMAGGIAGWIRPSSLLLELAQTSDEDTWQDRAAELRSKKREPWIQDCIVDAVSYITSGESFYLFCLYDSEQHNLLEAVENLKLVFAKLMAMNLVIPSQDLEASRDEVARKFDVFAVPVAENDNIDTACRDAMHTFGLPKPLAVYLPDDTSVK